MGLGNFRKNLKELYPQEKEALTPSRSPSTSSASAMSASVGNSDTPSTPSSLLAPPAVSLTWQDRMMRIIDAEVAKCPSIDELLQEPVNDFGLDFKKKCARCEGKAWVCTKPVDKGTGVCKPHSTKHVDTWHTRPLMAALTELTNYRDKR